MIDSQCSNKLGIQSLANKFEIFKRFTSNMVNQITELATPTGLECQL
jgi:hypothetical protein